LRVPLKAKGFLKIEKSPREETMRQERRRWMKETALLAAVAGGLAMPASHAQAQTLRLLSSWAENDRPSYINGVIFQRHVREVSEGKLTISINGPEAVPPFEQLQPVSAGVFDILYTHGAYHVGSRGLALAADSIDVDLDKRRESGIWRFLDEYYQKTHSLKLLALTTQGTQGYHCYLRRPLSPENDWKGRKIRGVVSYHGVIRALGGEPVVLPMGEVYVGLERGVMDGSCGPAAGMLALRHYEVAKHRLEPTFGLVNVIFAMNGNRWRGLSEQQQKWLLDAGQRTEVEAARVGNEIVAEERAKLAEHGVQVARLPDDKGKMIQDVWRTSQWELADKCCGDAAKQLRELARKAGMTN
jgi:TRAP-type C4-dicarboxylate transport system substrate-binding protein